MDSFDVRIMRFNMKKIQVFITHWVNKHVVGLNDALIEQVTFLERVTDYPHETTVVYWCPHGDNSIDEIFDRLPNGVRLVKNDRPGRPDIQPSMRNKIIDLADDYFVLLHNDIRISVGWLTSLVADLEYAESIYNARCVMSPRFIPYHYIPGIIEFKYPEFSKLLESNVCVSSIDKMRQWCDQWKFKFENNMVYSLPPGSIHITDDGHQLMMFISSKKFFTGGDGVDGRIDGIGYCDEKYVGWGYDDNDWGVTALMNGKKNLKSQTSLIGHIVSLTFGNPMVSVSLGNDNVFKNKWGDDIYNEMQTGQLWVRLHDKQKKLEGLKI